MREQQALEAISRKLDIIIRLLFQLGPKKTADKDNIIALQDAGLSIDEIARAVGKTTNSVYLILSRSRRRKK
ncbi:MAG: hypothetical protein IH847_07995 [Acidobacteria bacterium]|nr:hypothetical protein [Acidobacteriota bacterium]